MSSVSSALASFEAVVREKESQVTALTEQITRLQGDFDYNLSLLDARDAELREYDERSAAWQAREGDLQERLRGYTDHSAQLVRAEVARAIHSAHGSWTAEREELRRALDEATEEARRKDSQIAAHAAQCPRQIQELQAALGRATSLNEINEARVRELERATRDLKQHQQESTMEMRGSKSNTAAQIAELSQRREELERGLERAEIASQSRISALNQRVAESESRCEEQAAVFQRRELELTERAKSAQSICEALKTELVEAEKECDKWRKALRSEKVEGEQRLREAEQRAVEERARLSAEAQGLRSKCTALGNLVATYEEESLTLRSKMETEVKRHDATTKQLKECSEALLLYKSQLEEVSNREASSRKDLLVQKNEVSRLFEENRALRESGKGLVKDEVGEVKAIADLQKQKGDAEAALLAAQEEIAHLKSELESTRLKLSEAQNAQLSAGDGRGGTGPLVERLEKENAECRERARDLQDKNEKLIEAIRQMRMEMQAQQQQQSDRSRTPDRQRPQTGTSLASFASAFPEVTTEHEQEAAQKQSVIEALQEQIVQLKELVLQNAKEQPTLPSAVAPAEHQGTDEENDEDEVSREQRKAEEQGPRLRRTEEKLKGAVDHLKALMLERDQLMQRNNALEYQLRTNAARHPPIAARPQQSSSPAKPPVAPPSPLKVTGQPPPQQQRKVPSQAHPPPPPPRVISDPSSDKEKLKLLRRKLAAKIDGGSSRQ